jgi:membrane protein implicated in regulation of membrane protease activity
MNFALFAVVSVFSAAFVYRFIPETKGKTFKEIEMIFSEKKIAADSDGGGGHVLCCC